MDPGPAAASAKDTCDLIFVFAGMLAALVNEEIKQTNLLSPQPQITESYDFVVVGAGSAGSVVASRLSENPEWRVLLLETGGPETPLMDIPGYFGLNFGNAAVHFFESEPNSKANNGEKLLLPRGRVLGGSGTINANVYVRGNRRDYDRWAKMGNPGWDYKNVLRYFKKSENNIDPVLSRDTKYHGTGGPLSISRHSPDTLALGLLDAFEWLGFEKRDFNGKEQVGVGLTQLTTNGTTRQSANVAFLNPVKHRENLHIKTHSTVTKIVLHETKRHAKGVEYLDSDGKKHLILAGKEVIVSAGALESPKILMLSGIGPKRHLKSKNIPLHTDLPVGKNLQDHPLILPPIAFKIPNPTLSEGLSAKVYQLTNYLERKTGSLIEIPNPIMAYKSFTEDVMEADISYFSTKTLYGTGCFAETDLYTHIGFIPVLMRPESKGQILLRDSNPLSDPVVELNLLHSSRDFNIIKKAMKYLVKLKDAPAMANLNLTLDTTPLPRCSKYTFGEEDYWDCVVRAYSGTCYHQASTQMHRDFSVINVNNFC